MPTLNRYIASRAFRAILVAFIVVTSIIMLVDFVEGTRNLDLGVETSAGKIFLLTALKTPNLVEQTIPFVILFGVMGALHNLNKRSELIVIRASGLSAWRFLRPVIVVTALIGLIWAALLNPLASRSLALHDQIIAGSAVPGSNSIETGEVWLREGTDFEQTVIYAQRADRLNRTLYNVEFNVFDINADGNVVFSKRYDAKKAVLLPSNYWQLTDAYENSGSGDTEMQSAVSWPSQLDVADFQNLSGKSTAPQFWQLPREIKKLESAGFSSVALRMQFHKLLSLPFTLIAMTFIAAGVSMHLTREGGTFRLLLSGVAVGFGVFFIENIIKAFGESGAINVVYAVWIVPLLVLAAGIVYLSRIEDG